MKNSVLQSGLGVNKQVAVPRYPIPAATVTGPVAYWTSDTGGAITDQYVISCTYTPVGAQAPVTITRTIASRPLKPTGTMASQPNADVDMLQRLMIQDFFIDKGRLSQYNIGQYQDAAQVTYTTSNKFNGVTVQYSPVAEEVKNYEQFSMGAQNPSTTLDGATLQSMWGMLAQIQQASISLSQGEIGNGVNSSDPHYNAWVQKAANAAGGASPLAPMGLVDTNHKAVSDATVLEGFAWKESGQEQSIAHAAPIAASDEDTNVGEPGPAGNPPRYYTDDGIGFVQIQFYNEKAGLDIFDPAQNLENAAKMIAAYISDPANPGANGTAAEVLAYAAYKYHVGNFGVNGSLTSNGKAYVEGLFAHLKIALPPGF